uniref:ABC transporter domain-containing protein n=1 Tax=Piliocolobus tephrosceles TaxID=591936 RepID=A0A8C9H3V1_9PRIM
MEEEKAVNKQESLMERSLYNEYKHIKYEFKDVKCSVKNGELEILHGIKGILLPGTITIIMGPSGSGKTTLLNVLSMNISTGVEGTFLVNDLDRNKNIKKYMGYVLQEDHFFPKMTVYETIEFSAKLKLDIRDKKKLKELVKYVLDIMGLYQVKDTIVGDAFVRGISGGQRKRLSIACEILSNPLILLMDEPTSGLDSACALSVVECIESMAKISNTTIVSSLHQPSSQVFTKFDKLIAITNGYIVYHGKTTNLNKYFNKIGFICPYGWNIADYLLYILSNLKYESILLEKYNKYLTFSEENGYFMNIDIITNEEIHDDSDNAISNITNTPDETSENLKKIDFSIKKSITQEMILNYDENKLNAINKIIGLQEKKTPYFRQNLYLLIRAFNKITHDELTLVKIFDLVTILTIFSMLWANAFSKNTLIGVQDTIGAIFFILSYWTFYPAYLSLYSFPTEREVIMKERNMKTYKISNYFFSKAFAEFFYFFNLIGFWVFIAHIILYGELKIGMYFGYFFIILLNALISSSLGFFISALFNNIGKAVSLLSVTLLTMTLTNGFYVEISKLKAPINWLQWLSYQSYSASVLTKMKYNNTKIVCSNLLIPQCVDGFITGDAVLGDKFIKLNIYLSTLILI